MAMTDRELLDRIRAVMAELDELIVGAAQNAKYHTRSVLVRARYEAAEAEAGLVWHVEGEHARP